MNKTAQSNSIPLWVQMKSNAFNADDIIRHFNVTGPMVDVVDITKKMGVILYEQNNLSYDGSLNSSNNTATIIVNTQHPIERKRFTIAHELGHLMLHQTGLEFVDAAGKMQFDSKEKEANDFAFNLLMPTWFLCPLVGPFNGNIKSLAKVFVVSEQAMTIRIRTLYNL